MTTKLFISLLSVPYFRHKAVIELLDPFVDGFHIDAMDDHFVDNLAFAPDMIHQAAHYTKKTAWLHLMVDNPEKWIERAYILKKNDRITIHCEILSKMPSKKQMEIMYAFKQYGLSVGIAINPATPISACSTFLEHVDHLLIMTVNPGFSGQAFIESMKQKIKDCIDLKKNGNHSYRIAVDGGITKTIFDELKSYPVDDFVLGSALFSENTDPISEITKVYK